MGTFAVKHHGRHPQPPIVTPSNRRQTNLEAWTKEHGTRIAPETPMEDTHIMTLAAIMVGNHGERAEFVARFRARRCQRISEESWSSTWNSVANYIAETRLLI
jgi:hypothetical protein